MVIWQGIFTKRSTQKISKLEEIKSRIDWLKGLFKIVITIMVADIAGIAK